MVKASHWLRLRCSGKEAASHSESRLRETVGKKTRYEEELSALNAQLEQARKDWNNLDTKFWRFLKQIHDLIMQSQYDHISPIDLFGSFWF